MLKILFKILVDVLINYFIKEWLVILILIVDEKFLIFMFEYENVNDYKNVFFKMIVNMFVFNEKVLLECLEKYLEIKELEKFFIWFKNKIGLYL